jgi:S-adenosylmethionine synthetase
LNVAATRALAKLCAFYSIVLIYISSDYVFPGTEGDAPYEVTSEPKPPNLYGETKLAGEKAVLEEYGNAKGSSGWGVVLRVPVLYGEAESPAESAINVLMDAVWKAQEKDSSIKMDHWAIRYPTNTEDVARVCEGTSSSQLLSIIHLHLLIRNIVYRTRNQVPRYKRPHYSPSPLAILLRR